MRVERKTKQNVHDHSGTRGKRKVFYAVSCEKYRKLYAHLVGKVLTVAAPEGRAARRGGYPSCRAEKALDG